MKIIIWNCNMAFRNKVHQVVVHNPDVLIIPECEHPDKFIIKQGLPIPNDILWEGSNLTKGLGVFSYCKYKFKLVDNYNADFKIVLPIQVSDGNHDFVLFAIWANNPLDKDGNYITQVWKAINYYEDLLVDKATILAGDFNSNMIWDKPRRIGNHSDVVNLLASKGIYSVYHDFYGLEQGKERHSTLYMYRRKEKPYHIDYCFASRDFIGRLTNVDVGIYDEWNEWSDHMPLFVEFDIDQRDLNSKL